MGKRPHFRAPDGMPGIWGMALHTAGTGYQNLRLYSTVWGYAVERLLRSEAPRTGRSRAGIPDNVR